MSKIGHLYAIFVVSLSVTYLVEGLVGADNGHCIMYDVCGKNDKSQDLNCATNKTAQKVVDKESLDILQRFCPAFIENNGSDTYTCCAKSQLLNINKQFTLPQGIFSRCPACLRNFYNIFCYFTCSPHQSKFVTNVKTTTCPQTSKPCVTGVDYSLSSDFGYGVFNSCKDVQMPTTNGKAVNLMCGNKNPCEPLDFYQFLGDANQQSPFQINFFINDTKSETFSPLNVTANPCDQPLSQFQAACSCADCAAACPALPPPHKFTTPCQVFNLSNYQVDCFEFTGAILFAVVFLIIGAYIVYHVMYTFDIFGLGPADQSHLSAYKPGAAAGGDSTFLSSDRSGGGGRVYDISTAASHSMHEPQADLDISSAGGSSTALIKPLMDNGEGSVTMFDLVGVRLERGLERFFTWWATICVTHPLKVLIFGL